MMASLLAAARAGDVDNVRTLLQQGKYPVDYCDSNGVTPLHYACQNGHLNVVRVLLSEFKANLNIKSDAGRTPLMLAVRKGHEDVVLALLRDYQCPVTDRDNDGWGVLHHACAGGSVVIVQTLIAEHKADVSALNDKQETPLVFAFNHQKIDVVLCLIHKFGCDPNVKDSQGQILFHYACERGDVDLVQALILHKADVNAHSKLPLIHVAFRAKKYEVLLSLISAPSCDPYMKDQDGQTVLHLACKAGNIDLVNALLHTHEMDVNALNEHKETPLFVAITSNRHEVALTLIKEHGCDTDVAYSHGKQTILHLACKTGNIDLVNALLNTHKMVVNALNKHKETPLHVAVASNQHQVALALIKEHNCNPNVANSQGETPLHYACEHGDVDLVQALILHKANVNAGSKFGRTPLQVAFRAGKYEVLHSLISDPSCDPYITDWNGQTVLHLACEAGNVDLVNTLLHTHKMDVNALNEHIDTPLHVAVTSNQHEVALALVRQHGCDTNVANSQGQTPLHYACKCGGKRDLVQVLIHKQKASVSEFSKLVQVAYRARKHEVLLLLMDDPRYDPHLWGHGQTVLHLACKAGDVGFVSAFLYAANKIDVNALNEDKEMPLHVAAASNKGGSWGGHYDVVLALVSDARCDPSARGHLGRTALHVAAYQGHYKVVEELLKFTSPFAVDELGNTPLHLASENFNVSTVQSLLHDNAPVLVRNANGKTPRDLAWGACRGILEEYIRVNRKQLSNHYSTILKLADKKYYGSHWLTRIFVVGNPGAGKSSFVESLKREGFFVSFSKVSESSVPPHTAGIIPSVHMSSQYGRVLFYDFAGDVEYYSSHAAIFESLASSRKGDNIFIIVVDMREDSVTIKTTLHYWFSFIQYQNFSRSSFIVVGGHLDQSVEQSECLDEFCTAMQPNVHNIKHFMLDCRDPRSSQIAQVKKQIFTWVNESQKYELSSEARLLLGLLEKDFSAVTACPVQTVVSHIKDCGGWLPVRPKPLHQILLELHEVGVLLLLGDCTKDTDHVILNISQLTNEVHEILFSTSAFSNIQGSKNFNIGILPDSILTDVLPQYITKECLIQLQYCQEIHNTDVGLFPSLELTDSTSQSFIFFPALCSADKGELPWDESASNSFSIGWLALCTDLHDYFPPRFLHVLLLRLVYGFTLAHARQMTAHSSPEHSRRCTMWKKGVYWKMEEGVDCMVELVKGNKGVVALCKSSLDGTENCVKIFTKVVSCVMEAKAEFCHFTKPEFFLFDSSADADYLNEDHLFAMSDVEKALWTPEAERVISVIGNRGMDLSNLQWMRTLTYWNTFFPITSYDVFSILEEVVDKISELGQSLDAPLAFLESLRADLSSDVNQKRIRVVNWWMKSSSTPPCWYTLVEALIVIGRSDLAEKLRIEHGLHIQLQEKMLSGETQALEPDEEFLHSLSGVVGSRWPALAASLVLTEGQIEELKKKTGLSQQKVALQMLKIWASKEEATYGQLYYQLKTISLFQHSS